MFHNAQLRDAVLREHLYFFTWKGFAALHPGTASRQLGTFGR